MDEDLHLDRTSEMPLYRQIVEQVMRRIEAGELRPGTPLPPERKLAASLGVNRTTVVTAYRELVATGRVEARVGHGTWVSDAGADEARSAVPWQTLLTPAAERLRDPGMSDLLATMGKPGTISFGAGAPAPEHFPIARFEQALAEAIAAHGPTVFEHGAVPGWAPLREALAAWTRRGDGNSGTARAQDVVVLHGSQQGLDLLTRVLLEPGDAVVVESPTYLGALQAFRGAGARLLPVPLDRDGMRLDRLDAALARHRPKFIYILPTFQNPTGTTLPLARRHALLALAARYGVPVVEDDPYGALAYGAPAPPTLHALDPYGGVIYLSTMSKVFLPGLRLGWLVAPPPVAEAVTLARQTSDVHPNSAMQHVLHAFLTRGWLAEHVTAMRAVYKGRRDVMLTALDTYAPPGMTWTRPTGGYYVWCRLPNGLRARALAVEAAREGVALVAGDLFSPDRGERDAVRLNFTGTPEASIPEGVRRLCTALRRLSRDEGATVSPALTGTRPVV